MCLVAPAFGFTTPIADRIVWMYVLLAGLPVSVMAMLLAGIHAKHRLIDGVYRSAAIVWAASATLVLTPLQAWVSSLQAASALHWVRMIATALVALLFVGLTTRVWKLPWMERISLTLAFASVALFFGNRAGGYIFGMNTTGLEAESEALAEFFVEGVLTCVLLSPGVVTGWIIARRHHERGRLTRA
jgi:hypothetical protein